MKEDDPVRNGVYAARVRIDGSEHEAVVNIGHRPTVGNGPDRVLEAHLLDFEGDLYGQTIEVELLEFLREERRFGSTEELSRQIEADKKRARERLRRNSNLRGRLA
ncbi:MAG: riboflavin kinase [Alistipes sp.]